MSQANSGPNIQVAWPILAMHQIKIRVFTSIEVYLDTIEEIDDTVTH